LGKYSRDAMSLLPLSIESIGTIVASGGLGIVVGFVVGRRQPTIRSLATSQSTSDEENEEAKASIETMMVSLHDLTAEVGEQVGQHSSRVSEITHALDPKKPDDSAQIVSAGESLVSANEDLQAALADAKAEIEWQRSELRRSIREARTDALTGLPNRRAFDQELSRSIATFRRKAMPFCLVMMDIDRFKQLNDQHGHMIGDQVLKAFARCLTETFRETDFVTRYGGEEFAAILPQTTLREALTCADRARNSIALYRCSAGEIELTVTASFGVKEITAGETNAEIITRTDEALYAAKESGRNCCCFREGTTIHKFAPEPPKPMADNSCADSNNIEDSLN
jgi:diguanylate cyclase